jgi:hypothetical protein
MPSRDDTTSIPNGPRRDPRIPGRRSWRRRVLLVLVLALLASATAYAVTGPFAPSDERGASRPNATASPLGAAAAGSGAPACRTPLTWRDPLRVWIGGDSLAGSLGPSLGDLTRTSGVVQAIVDSRVSSGLLSPDFFDWSDKGADDMFSYDPDVAVFVIGTNDAKNLPKGAARDLRWRERYAAVVEQMLDVLVGEGRTVYWVGGPIMSENAFSERVKIVNSVFQEVTAQHPEVTYVDAFTVFSGPDGKFAPALPRGDGKVVRVRAEDGVHFTPDGGDLLAQAVLERLEPQCRIAEQAVEGGTQPIVEVEGSDSVPGTRRRGSRTESEPRR